MNLQCRIVYNQDNTINYLETPQGDRSELFDELVQVMGGDKNSALNLYALTESEDFKTLYNGYIENKPVPVKYESKVEQKTQEYLDRINAIKQQDPDSYWSVDVPSEATVRDAVKNDRLVEVYGGMAIVEQDGNMIGLFKDKPDAKNVAKDLQRMRIEKGGIKTDNFDGYLTKLYEKNGFKVASRIAFNEEIAPPGWSKEKHGTPDVVFMIYDPNNSLKIEEKSFTKDQYNEAQSYRDSYVERAKKINYFYINEKQSREGTGWNPSRGNQTLEGAPIIEGATGADPRLVNVAEEYARLNNIEYKRQPSYVEVDEARAKRIAEEYDKMEHNPQDPKVKESYENLIRQTTAQYKVLQDNGYEFYFFDENNDPYDGNPWNAMRDLRNNKTMAVFATEAGFGSGASELNVEDNPLLADTGLEWGFGSLEGQKKRVLANDLFRAVHDAFGHGLEGAGFRARGEENAWQAHVRMFTGSAVGAITSETRGQNSWLNYGKFGDKNQTAKIEDTVFADQKTGLMPEWTWKEGVDKPSPLTGGAAFANFFAKITNTKDGGARFSNISEVLNKPIDGFERELEAYLKYGKNFQKHIMASIPGFVDARIRVLKGMTEASKILGTNGEEVNMLDITSSEGYFTKAYAQLAQDSGVNAKADALDAGVTFQRDFKESPQVPNVNYLLQAWGESFVDPDTGIRIPLFKPTKKYGVVFEGMGFQFFTPTREKEVKEVKNMMDDRGIFVTMEKLKNPDYEKREVLKDQFKERFFTKEEMAQKAATVLKKSDEASVGMMDYQYGRTDYENVLAKNFKYVVQFYSSGNFAGYLASDSMEVIEATLKGTGDTTTKFNEEVTPRIIKGDSSVSLKRAVKGINGDSKKITAEDVLTYANSTNDVLTTQQIIDLQDVIMSLGVDNSLQAEEMLNKALVFKGVVTFNKKRMLDSGAFNSYEVSEILSNPERQKTLKKVLQALKNTEIIELEYPKENVKTKQEINSFGKQSVENPFIEEVQGKEVEVLTVDNLGNLSKKTIGSDTQAILENTVIEKSNIKLSENIEFLKDISPSVWNGNRKAISKILEEIKEDAIENGIDLKNFSEKAYTKSRGQILDFLQDLEVAEFDVLADSYNEMFDLNTPVTETINTESEFDIYMEDNISEYDAFKEFSLIKKAPSIYRKVADKPLEELYRIAAINNKKTVEEVQKEVRENPINLPTFEGDTEVLEKIKLYKQHFKFQENTTAYREEPQSREYIQKANKWLLKTKNPYYKITAKGLEAVSNDPLTKMRAEMTLPKDLVIEKEEDFTDENLAKRKEYFYNVQLLEKLNSDYVYLEDQVIAVRNNEDSFIKTPKGVAEIVYKNGNVSFYSLVQENLEKPGTDINFRKFEYLETTPEVFKKPKNYYTKEELKEINNKNFDCN